MKCLSCVALLVLILSTGVYWGVNEYLTLLELRSASPSPTETMTAICYEKHGDSSVLQMKADYPRPEPLPDQVLVKVHFAALNPVDYKMRRNAEFGMMIPKPKIPSEDMAGVIVSVGPSVPGRFKVGDRVAAMMPIVGTRWGASAQFAAVSHRFLAHVPDNVSLDAAAAAPLASLTVLQAFDKLEQPTAGKSILVQAGAGGCGSFAIQWASKVLGMHVSTTCSERNVEFVQSLGAKNVINYKTHAFERELSGLDVVLDAMSYEFEQRTLESAVLKADSGHYLAILGSDFSLGSDGKENCTKGDTFVNFGSAKVGRLMGRKRNHDVVAVNPNGPQLQQVLNKMGSGDIVMNVEKVFPLAQAAEAQDLLQKGHTRGKIVLEIPHSE